MSDDLDPEGLFGPRLPAHLYIHVPFCASKCAYCDFASVSGASGETVSAVFYGIWARLQRWADAGLDGVVETVYVGGGTPSSCPEWVARVLEYVRTHFAMRGGAEITVEGNPDSLDADVVRELAAVGVTRISVGVQSFDDSVLRMLGRRHSARSAWDACQAVRDAGLDLSLDLMCGVPGQSITSWSETLARAAATGACHVSVYPLTVEEGTPLQVAIGVGLLDEPDSDVAAEMMLLAETTLDRYSLHRYEVANYAQDHTHESRHNTAYWTGRSYIGVGPGAHGMLDAQTARAAGLLDARDETTARVRYANADDITEWIAGREDSVEKLTAEEVAREDVMLGMRLVRGVTVSQVEAARLGDVFAQLAALGLVELTSAGAPRPRQRWRTTERGWLLGNEVFSRIWAGE